MYIGNGGVEVTEWGTERYGEWTKGAAKMKECI